MTRLTFVFLCLFSLTRTISAESDSWNVTIHSASNAHDAGHYQQAKKLFEQAVEEADVFPANDPRRAETKTKLAGTLLELGEYLECEQLCLRAIEFLGEHHPEEKLQIARAELILAKLYLNLQLDRLAEQYRAAVLKLTDREGEAENPVRAELQALADDSSARRNLEQAGRAVSTAETVYGKQHPRYAECLSTLATAYRHNRDYDKSEQLSKQAIQILTDSLGADHPKLSAAVENLAWIDRSRGRSAEASAHRRESIRHRFSTLSDADLCYFFGRLLEHRHEGYRGEQHVVLETYLTEMARRGGSVIENFLTGLVNEMQHNRQLAARMLKQLDDARATDGDLFWKTMERRERESDNLEILTALRRAQQKPDPLKIFIKDREKEVSCVFPDLPVLEVAIRNVDVEQREVGFTEGGNYRSGRQARWRIEVTDANGKTYEPRQLTGLTIGGGQYTPSTLKAGEGWQTWLAMESFVDTLPFGEYQMRILYHNQITIVDSEFTEGLIVSRSDPIKLIVQPREISVTKQQQQTIDEVLPQLDEKLPVKIVSGNYGPWTYEFIEPDSQYGRLLALDWSAVPSLIAELQRDGQTPAHRAHLLALLYSITGENHPAGDRQGLTIEGESNALGNYSCIDIGWSTWGKREGAEGGGGGFGGHSDPYQREGQLNPKQQEPFIKNWQEFSQHLKVVHKD